MQKIKPQKMEIKIIAGLGNFKAELSQTYHNAGYLFIDFMCGNNAWKNKNNFMYQKKDGFIFIKTKTYMNESGFAIKEALNYFKVNPENMLLAHDDADLFCGKYKIQFGKNSAGHKGVSSIIDFLKTKNFWRARIGIRKEEKVGAKFFVLEKMKTEDLEKLQSVFKQIKNEILKSKEVPKN
jgi:PTH1 family peptidyl-tRNA hydrolase